MNDATTDPKAAHDPERPPPDIAQSLDQPSTGDAQVDAAVARLGELDGRELDQHAEVYDDIHRSLGSVLDGPSEAAGP